ncbi:hypothetical protein [Nocardioides sp.]|uniref:hypothetical protein n=1 Tax=Nocardioides sp. TaxID=35761 RepID=UPI0027247853|nr:hypothetical protein [Nocardioides sp.]MDO9454735.1 hypothetical protein [Nocardioides sp.]
MDLSDPTVRAVVTARLGELYAGRPVVLGPGVLAGYTTLVTRLRALGCPVLVLATGPGAGPVPGPGDCTVVPVRLPPTASLTDEVRVLDRATRSLPPDVVAAVEAFDPGRRALWHTRPFVVTDEPVLGRQVTGGRPAAWLALEDKLLADQVWDAAGVERAAYRVCEIDAAALDDASTALADPATGLGVVWSGDARDGVNGGGDYVRWVVDERDRAAAYAFFAPRCDRVRVMPFLDGVPCSIHGTVLGPRAGGTAVFRPVELATLRRPATRTFVPGGLSTWWDPPSADREEMRSAARRVGDHLAAAHGYRGAFGIDGVLTADGFRPTELNTRASAGVSLVAQVDPAFFTLLQDHLLLGLDPGLTVDEVESVLPLIDAQRSGRPSTHAQGVSVGGTSAHDVVLRDGRLERAADGVATGTTLVAADVAGGFFAKLDPCRLLAPGDRLAPLNVALLAHLDATSGTGFGALEAAPDLRT